MPKQEYPKKIIIVSDSISSHSGLARITRDIASRIHDHLRGEFTVATAGWNGTGLADFPWKDYPINNIEGWLLPELPKIANHFAGEEELIVFFISDVSRLGWFAHPDWCPIPELAEWSRSPKIRKWIYAPVDAEGPNGKLSFKLDYILKGFDRVLNYSQFSVGVTGYPDWLPHGIDTDVFKPRDKVKAREIFKKVGFTTLTEKSFLVGIVATNQPRKDWALGFETAKVLLDRGVDVQLWCHTDMIERHWDLGALTMDFGMQGRVCITTQDIPDETMSWLYSACDVTLAPSSEGFGFPIYESIACGTPVIHHKYAGGAEWLPWAIPPLAYRHEGPYCMKRPVGDAQNWAYYAQDAIESPSMNNASLPSELDWNGPTLWNRWKEWLTADDWQKKMLEHNTL